MFRFPILVETNTNLILINEIDSAYKSWIINTDMDMLALLLCTATANDSMLKDVYWVGNSSIKNKLVVYLFGEKKIRNHLIR